MINEKKKNGKGKHKKRKLNFLSNVKKNKKMQTKSDKNTETRRRDVSHKW